MVGPMTGPGPAGSGRAWASNMKLFRGPGRAWTYLLRAGPGPGLIIKFAGRARAGSAQLLRGGAWALNHICGPGMGLDFRPVQGPSVWWRWRCVSPRGWMCLGETRVFSLWCSLAVLHRVSECAREHGRWAKPNPSLACLL